MEAFQALEVFPCNGRISFQQIEGGNFYVQTFKKLNILSFALDVQYTIAKVKNCKIVSKLR